MKTIFILSFALLSFTFFAQSDSTKNDNETEIDLGDVSIIIKDNTKTTKTIDGITDSDEEKPKEDKYPNVDFETSFGWGVAGFSQENANVIFVTAPEVTSDASLDLDYSQSRNYMINGNLMFDIHKNFGILTGFGFEFNRFVFKENLQVDPNNGGFMKDSVISFGSYKFKTNYLNVPLMMVFKSNNQKFKFAVGGTFSYNIGNKVKQEYSIENVEYKSEIKGNYNIAPIKLSVGARLAYKGIGIYANYGLTEMNDNFISQSSGVSNLMPFSAGITFGGL